MKFANRIALLLIFCTALSVRIEGIFGFSSGKRDVVKETLSQIAETGRCDGCDCTGFPPGGLKQALQIAIAKKNKGRIERIVLRGCNLSDQDLSGLDLNDAWLLETNFTGANLSNSSFCNAVLKYALFKCVNASGACMNNVQAWDSQWSDSNLSNVSFEKADLSSADMSGSNINGAKFDGADLGCARMHNLKGFEYASFKNIKYFPKGADVRFEINSQNSLLYAFLKKCKGIIEKMINNDIPADY